MIIWEGWNAHWRQVHQVQLRVRKGASELRILPSTLLHPHLEYGRVLNFLFLQLPTPELNGPVLTDPSRYVHIFLILSFF